MVKVYLDDVRIPPPEWILTTSVQQTIDLLKTNTVDILSLDHDLGPVDENGYDVLLWIEKEVFLNGFNPPEILVHSANPPAVIRMNSAINSIYTIFGKNNEKN